MPVCIIVCFNVAKGGNYGIIDPIIARWQLLMHPLTPHFDFCGISGSAAKCDLFKVDLIDAEDWSEPLRQQIQGEGVELLASEACQYKNG
jgi:hypothetical protein